MSSPGHLGQKGDNGLVDCQWKSRHDQADCKLCLELTIEGHV